MINKNIKLAVFVCLLAFAGVTNVLGDVWIGGLGEPKKIPSSQAKGLIALIVARGGLNLAHCSYVLIRRVENGVEISRRIDTWAIMAKFSDDFPLLDGDVVSVPEHMIGCLNHKSYNQALQAYLAAKAKSNTAPPNWADVLESAGGSCGRALLRSSDKK